MRDKTEQAYSTARAKTDDSKTVTTRAKTFDSRRFSRVLGKGERTQLPQMFFPVLV
jgi:hypothetical protein